MEGRRESILRFALPCGLCFKPSSPSLPSSLGENSINHQHRIIPVKSARPPDCENLKEATAPREKQRKNMEQDYPGLKDGEISTGTTIMAVQYNGGVIMGADSRTSTGTYVANRVSDKITSLHDHIYACRSGSAADTQAITDYVRYFLASHSVELGRLPLVKTAAKMARGLCYNNKDRLLAGMIIAGWDPVEGGTVYEIPLGGTMMKQKFAIGGSGSTYIYGHVDAEFRENMTKEEAQQFVRKAISHAMARDGSSGGVIRMVVIDKAGVSREYIEGDKLPFGP